MNQDLQTFLKQKAKIAPKWANYLASLHSNTWYYCEFNNKEDVNAVRHYKLAGLYEGDIGQWFKLEDLK